MLKDLLFTIFLFIYNHTGQNIGIAIIVITVLIRIIVFPLSQKSIRGQMKMSAYSSEIKEIQKKFKTKEEQSRELMKFYKENKINPFSGCLPLLIQLPVLIALYKVFMETLKTTNGLINPVFWGLNLAKTSPIMAILAGIAQFFASQMTAKHTVTMPQPGASEKNIARQKMMTKQMNYFLPVLTVIFGWTWPAGLPFYWLINTFLGMVQDYYLYKKYGANKENNRKSI